MKMKFRSTASNDIEKKAHRKVIELMELTQYYGLRLPYEEGIDFSMKFDLNSVNTAGIASYLPSLKKMVIRIHKKGLVHYGDEFIDSTVVHELAHIIQYINFPTATAHGREFKAIMRMFGADESRCHSFDLRTLVGKPRKFQPMFKYECGCAVHEVTKIKHNRIVRGDSYICKRCKSKLVAV